MEERLFFIGLAMGAYAWGAKRVKKKTALEAATKRGLWHAGFCALAAFSVALVVALSMETRSKPLAITGNIFSSGELVPAFLAALVFGAVGFVRGAREPKEKRGHFLAEDLEWAETVFSAVLLAAVLMYFVVQAFKIPSGSMEKTLLIGDHLFVNKFIYGLRVPFSGSRVLPLKPVNRGDIIVFRFPVDDPRELHCGSVQYRKDFIKRVVAIPGDTVQVRGGRAIVNGKPVPDEAYAQYVDGAHRQPESVRSQELSREQYQKLWQSHELDKELQEIQRDYFGPVVVPDQAYFVMGDNRDRSCDSRYWGPVERKYLKGKAWFIYWPPARMRIIDSRAADSA